MSKHVALPKLDITSLRAPCDGYVGMAAAVELQGVPVIVLAGSLKDLDSALPGMTLDHKLCARVGVVAAVNFTFKEDEL